MGYYPILLDMTGKRCVVIGGGAVAERKAEGLLQVEADVTVISPRLARRLESLAQEGKIGHAAREYRPGDLAGYDLAFVATDDDEVNVAVFREGKARGVWVNAADDPAHCDFILPSVLRRGDLIVAVATGGSSPALSRAIREDLEAYFTAEYATLVRIVAEVREELRERPAFPDPEDWRMALDGELHRLVKEGDQEGAKAYLFKRLGAI